MFNRTKKETSDSVNAAKEIGLLGIDTRFEGSIRFQGTLRIDGAVIGNIHSKSGGGSLLIINQQASVTGDIVTDSVLISGRVEGNVRAKNRVEIFRSGYLKGDIHTADIMIEGGAEFEGYCHMIEEDAETGRAEVPSATPASSRGKETEPSKAGASRQPAGTVPA